MTNLKFPSEGLRGRIFLPLFLGLLMAVFALGVYGFQPPADVVEQTVARTTSFLPEFLAKFAIALAMTLVHGWLVFALALGTPLSRLRGRFEKSHNDSHAYLLIGIAATAITALVAAGGANLTQYLYVVSTRGALGYIAGTIATMVIARVFGVRNMQEFRDWIDTEDNDSYAILIAGIHVLAMILAMNV